MPIYNCFIFLYVFLIRILSPFNKRARAMLYGRKKIWEEITLFSENYRNEKVIWIHAASLGEFEQGRPLIEEIKKTKSDFKILLTFFSPSGYSVQKDYPLADKVIYLPFDTPSNAKKFLSLIKPTIAIFIKYEFWLNYLNELQKNKIRTFLISAVFHPKQPFFKGYGRIFRKALNAYEFIFVQDKNSSNLLNRLNYSKHLISGDTRFDRVISVSADPNKYPEFEKFATNSFIVIAGSSYATEEEALLRSFYNLKKIRADLKLIIVPHHIEKQNINRIASLCAELHIQYCIKSKGINDSAEVLIVDAMGMLSSLYQFGKIAVIGGGFKDGIHSILEPAAFALPVIFGPRYEKFNEAIDLIASGAAFSVSNSKELTNIILNLLENETKRVALSRLTKDYVYSKSGVTQKIIAKIQLEN
jgi:3-deoxy-D-manno-octulosonic-acid transferase